jgi:hypothetical protein
MVNTHVYTHVYAVLTVFKSPSPTIFLSFYVICHMSYVICHRRRKGGLVWEWLGSLSESVRQAVVEGLSMELRELYGEQWEMWEGVGLDGVGVDAGVDAGAGVHADGDAGADAYAYRGVDIDAAHRGRTYTHIGSGQATHSADPRRTSGGADEDVEGGISDSDLVRYEI